MRISRTWFSFGTKVRIALAILCVGAVYLSVSMLLYRLVAVPYGLNPNILIGIFIGALMLGISMTTRIWIRWLALPPTETHPREAFCRQRLTAISEKAGLKVTLHVVAAKRIFIYATGIGEHLVVISDHALDTLSDDALDGVIAHEIAHMTMRHAHKNAMVFASLFGFRQALLIPSWINVLLVMWIFLYLRTNEYDADKVASFLVGTAPVIAALNEVQTATKFKEFGRLKEFLISTHPSYQRRREKLLSLAS